MEPAQDHKPVGDGDTGPNTGGMGAYSPTPVITDEILAQVERQILVPIVDAMNRQATPYRGVLYAGLMLTHNGPKVLEFNCRFGDPETQPILFRLQSDLVEVMEAVLAGRLDSVSLRWDPRPAICVVMAAGGYPGDYRKGAEITGLADAVSDDVMVFHAGTKRLGGKVVTAGGRVLGVTARGATLAEAQRRAYQAVERIHFDGAYYRHDIGAKALNGMVR
ncbi:MAG TPA: phosphoribosylamine--glycine ligase, partial [Phycisphaerae bacterium]|nr:phosphoribosylamine--glycine ligase [Phycisphaerae bacterium]